MALVVKNLLPMEETQAMWNQSLSWEDPLEEEMATHSGTLGLGNPMDRGAWWVTVHEATKSQTPLSEHTEHR